MLDKHRSVRLYWPTNMEEDQNTQAAEVEQKEEAPSFQESPQSGVSFPTVGQPQKSSGAKTILIIGILILIAILGFVVYKSASKKSEAVSVEPTPFDNLTTSGETAGAATGAPSATATPLAVDKSKIEIQVQNGTGIGGEAALLQTQLKGLGYTNVKVGNATSQELVATQVTFSSTLDAALVSEITKKLGTLYQKVDTSNSTTSTFDVVIVTGLRKGSTSKPSATPVASASPSASPKPSASP